MKNKITLLAVLTPFFMVGCGGNETTIASLPVQAHGYVYNFCPDINEVDLTISESSSASWANLIEPSMFTLPEEMKGKDIIKADRKSDKLVTLSFVGKAKYGEDAIKTYEMGINSKAFKGAKVNSSFAEINFTKSCFVGTESFVSGTSYYSSTGYLLGMKTGCTGEYGEEKVSVGIPFSSQNITVKGFKNPDTKGHIYIEADIEGNVTYEIYGYELDENNENYEITVPVAALQSVTPIITLVDNVALQFKFVKRGDVFRPDNVFGYQFFIDLTK